MVTGNNSYKQGRAKEYIAITDLEAMGYRCMRAAQSRGIADVIGWHERAIRFVQIKGYKDRPGAFTAEIAAMMSIQLPPNASIELWLKQTGQPGWVERILIKHTFPESMDLHTLDDLGREIRFTQNINPDEVTGLAKVLADAAKKKREAWKAKQKQQSSASLKTSTASTASAEPSSSTSPTTETPPAGATVARRSARAVATPASPAEQPPAVVKET